MKKIRLSGHAKDQLISRGATESEVFEVIRSSIWKPAKKGRMECKKEFPYEQEWNNKYYSTKRVRPVFIEKEDEILVVTIYTYFLI